MTRYKIYLRKKLLSHLKFPFFSMKLNKRLYNNNNFDNIQYT